jgi:C1A family cysteine protease
VSKFIPEGMGWIPDVPDPRDYTYRHEAVLRLLKRLKRSRRMELPDEVDLRFGDEGENFFTDPEDQGRLNSSAAFGVLSLVEYFERRVRGRIFEGSALFLYKVTRNRLHKRLHLGRDLRESHSAGDTGADLRTTFKVLAQFGVPPEEHWPYDIDEFDEEPSQFLYGLAKPLASVRYFHLDEPNCDGTTTWKTVKSFLGAGFPIAFGFPVPASLTANAGIPYRPNLDSIRGGQVLVAVGYKKHRFGRGQHGLLVRNSWGSQWGDNGNGWLPIAFVRNQLARNFWTLVSREWLDSSELSIPTVIDSIENK